MKIKIKKSEFAKMYNSMSVPEMSKKLGVSIPTIYRVIKNHNVPLKHHKRLITLIDDEVK